MSNIPTVPGIYVAETYPLGGEENYMPYYLTEDGDWYELVAPDDGDQALLLDRKQVGYLGRLTRIVLTA